MERMPGIDRRSTGGSIVANPATFTNTVVLTNGDGRLEIFVLNPANNNVYHSWQTSAKDPARWSGWENIHGSVVSLIGAQNNSGTLMLFGVGTDGAVWHTWQESGHPGGWHSWQSIGNPLS